MTDEMENTGEKAFRAKTEVYGPIPENAKPVGIFWAIPQIILMMIMGGLIAVVASIVGAIVLVMVAGAMGADIADIGEQNMPGWLVAGIMPIAIGGFFGGWALGAIIKTKMEKRSLHSIGLNGFLYGGRFWGGFGGGIVLAIVMTIPLLILGTVFGADLPESYDWSKLGHTSFLVATGVLLLCLMIQAPSEEIIFRGWLLSGVGAKHGLAVALIISSLFFGIAHGDRAVAGLPMAVFYITITAALGMAFAGAAIKGRSVIPAAGMHTGYNFTLLGIGMATVYAGSNETDFMAIIAEMMDVSSLVVPEMDFAYWREVGIRSGIPLAIGFWLLAGSGRNRDR